MVSTKPVTTQACRPIFQPLCRAASASMGRPRPETSSSPRIRFISRAVNWDRSCRQQEV